MPRNNNNQSLKNNQSGLAAIIVTVFVMIMLSLVVLAFSQIARREQRQALDRQLSSQAFYASEAGINNMLHKIRTNVAPDLDNVDPANPDTGCSKTVGEYSKLDTASTAAYSCVLYDKAPKKINYGNLDTKEGQVVSLATTAPGLDTVTFSWNGKEKTAKFDNCAADASTNLVSVSDNTDCSAGILRVELIVADPAHLSQDELANNTYTVFLRPTRPNLTAAPSVSYESDKNQQGKIVAAKCDTSTSKCSASITIPSGIGGLPMYAYLRSIYKNNDVTIDGVRAGAPVRFNDAQIMIDSTGRAQDVVKRLQVRVPLRTTTNIPGFVIESISGICKQINITGSTYVDKCNGPVTGGAPPTKDRDIPDLPADPIVYNVVISDPCTRLPKPDSCFKGTGPFVTYYWTANFENNSDKAPYKSCTWSYSDGTSETETFPRPPSSKPSICEVKQSPDNIHKHPFPVPADFKGTSIFAEGICNSYDVKATLTYKYADGTTKSFSNTQSLPNCAHGTVPPPVTP